VASIKNKLQYFYSKHQSKPIAQHTASPFVDINSQNLKIIFFPSWAPLGSIDRIILANQTEIFE
jgi:hypothetical protein